MWRVDTEISSVIRGLKEDCSFFLGPKVKLK